MASKFRFEQLIQQIDSISTEFASQASRTINLSLTLRNWCIGCYIHEYELRGQDRAQYGKKLIEKISKALQACDLARMEARELRRYKQFYLLYPQVLDSIELLANLNVSLPTNSKRESLTPISGNDLVNKLSFSHICELIRIEDETKRAFYEVESIYGNWSVRELKRQLNSLYYERSGLSLDKSKLSELANKNAETIAPKLIIQDPYIFEFIGLRPREVMSESHLEDQLLDQLQGFLLELSHGFCFEARQKSILIGDSNYFINLVFYHRILKCHILVELKLAEFNHEHIGQLNTYVSWYKKNMMSSGDNPPIGILLCTDKDHALVEYALAGMDDNLFVSKYQLELPRKEDMQKFIEEKLSIQDS